MSALLFFYRKACNYLFKFSPLVINNLACLVTLSVKMIFLGNYNAIRAQPVSCDVIDAINQHCNYRPCSISASTPTSGRIDVNGNILHDSLKKMLLL